jgi:hypothetical protein
MAVVKMLARICIAIAIGFCIAQGVNSFIIWDYAPISTWSDLNRTALLGWLLLSAFAGLGWGVHS